MLSFWAAAGVGGVEVAEVVEVVEVVVADVVLSVPAPEPVPELEPVPVSAVEPEPPPHAASNMTSANGSANNAFRLKALGA